MRVSQNGSFGNEFNGIGLGFVVHPVLGEVY